MRSAPRAASHFGQHLVKEHLAFAVRALDHEDPPDPLHALGICRPRSRRAEIYRGGAQ